MTKTLIGTPDPDPDSWPAVNPTFTTNHYNAAFGGWGNATYYQVHYGPDGPIGLALIPANQIIWFGQS